MRIVFADDLSRERMQLRRIMQELGFNVVGEAKNGDEAISLCQRFRPDVAILDMSMPGISGQQAAHIILDQNIAKHVVVCSSQMQHAITEPLLSRGAHLCMKPYDANNVGEQGGQLHQLLRRLANGDA